MTGRRKVILFPKWKHLLKRVLGRYLTGKGIINHKAAWTVYLNNLWSPHRETAETEGFLSAKHQDFYETESSFSCEQRRFGNKTHVRVRRTLKTTRAQVCDAQRKNSFYGATGVRLPFRRPRGSFQRLCILSSRCALLSSRLSHPRLHHSTGDPAKWILMEIRQRTHLVLQDCFVHDC